MQERRVAAIGGGKTGGLLNLLDTTGQAIVVAGAAVDGDGGAISVRNSHGVQIGRLGVDAAGSGEMAVYNASATMKKIIEAPTGLPTKFQMAKSPPSVPADRRTTLAPPLDQTSS